MKVLSPLQSRAGQIVIDAVICAVALFVAYLLRFEGRIHSFYVDQLIMVVPVIVLARTLTHWLQGIYLVVWRYVGLREALLFVRSVAVISTVLLALRLFLPVHAPEWRMPISVIILEGFFTFLGMIGARVLRRLLHERQSGKPAQSVRDALIPTLLVGAGDNGLAIAKEAQRHPTLGIQAVGYVDDDTTKQGMVIHGLRVLGAIDELARIVDDTGARQVIITSNAIAGRRILDISDVAQGQAARPPHRPRAVRDHRPQHPSRGPARGPHRGPPEP